MLQTTRNDARIIVDTALKAADPRAAVTQALTNFSVSGRLFVVAIGKAGCTMAEAAYEVLGKDITQGIVITKYHHGKQLFPGCKIFEAGHPIPDSNSLTATAKVLSLTRNLSDKDQVIFLISGGGSSLFEYLLPNISLKQLQSISAKLIHSGASIDEINCVRKHLSGVKGGRFAQWVAPAQLTSLILSDVIGDKLDVIASGPSVADASTSRDARAVLHRYHIPVSPGVAVAIGQETPERLPPSRVIVVGNVDKMLYKAAETAELLGYQAHIMDDYLQREAHTEARKITQKARTFAASNTKQALIWGGETVVKVRGSGVGGRCAHFALSAAPYIRGKENIVIVAVGSDGTDGPTDAAGGMIDGTTTALLQQKQIEPADALRRFDSYSALKAIDQLIITGPTGTNVNDLYMVLIGER